MRPFRRHTGLAVPLDRSNVDTDQIIPKQFLKGTGRTGYGRFLFYNWRFTDDDRPDPSFPLNAPRYAGATVLLAGKNFGCGSSREHAPWSLADFGFRVVIAPSFADIFRTNCLKNGLLPVALAEPEVAALMSRAAEVPQYRVTVDLERQTVSDGLGFVTDFTTDEFRRRCLLEGLDDISFTLQFEAQIAAYEAGRPPWQSAPAEN